MNAIASLPIDLPAFTEASLAGILGIVLVGAVLLGLLIWLAFSR